MNESLLKCKPKRIENQEIRPIYESERVVIIYPKKFGKIEQWIRKKIGGPKEVRRPLDRFTTFIWENCNGNKNIAEIITDLDIVFGEEVAPADVRVQKFITQLLELNLVTLIE